jgi:hypothetical protein
VEVEQAISTIKERISEAIEDRACPTSAGLNMTLCNGVPNCTCRECWILAIMYALKEEAE